LWRKYVREGAIPRHHSTALKAAHLPLSRLHAAASPVVQVVTLRTFTAGAER
jgi:hypothetical protein